MESEQLEYTVHASVLGIFRLVGIAQVMSSGHGGGGGGGLGRGIMLISLLLHVVKVTVFVVPTHCFPLMM